MPGKFGEGKVSLMSVIEQMIHRHTSRPIEDFVAFIPRTPSVGTTHHHVRADN